MIEGMEFPFPVAKNKKFSFKVVAKETNSNLANDVMTLLTSDKRITVDIINNVTPIILKNNEIGTSLFTVEVVNNTIIFSLNKGGMLSASLFSPNGKKVSSLFNQQAILGKTTIIVPQENTNVASGTYVLECNIDQTRVKKVMVIGK